jgi:hypothetical protein
VKAKSRDILPGLGGVLVPSAIHEFGHADTFGLVGGSEVIWHSLQQILALARQRPLVLMLRPERLRKKSS